MTVQNNMSIEFQYLIDAGANLEIKDPYGR